MKKKTVVLLVGVALCVGAGYWYVSRDGAKPANAKAGQAPAVVNVTQPQKRDVPVLLQANGTVQPLSSVDLHPQTTATISQVHIREGQFVKAGDIMFSLDARTEQANVE